MGQAIDFGKVQTILAAGQTLEDGWDRLDYYDAICTALESGSPDDVDMLFKVATILTGVDYS